ncbi:uncharacterized protein LOC135501660 [Lineus longissimus]|uniref:uncharacterized protein LOC135501660 n=1 Tax=Lineus longissimus TaxID=88925 RepID=UPI00315D95C5
MPENEAGVPEGRDAVRKSRSAAKGWVTRASNALKRACKDARQPFGKDAVSKVAIESCINDFDRYLVSFEKAQSEVEMTIEDELAQEQDIDQAFAFISEAKQSRHEAQIMLEEIVTRMSKGPKSKDSNDDFDDGASCASNSSMASMGRVRLPKLELPTFSGVITEWQSFWDQFTALVDENESIPEISKFSYLSSLLEGEAKCVIKGLPVTEENYHIASKLLTDRYGRRERIIFTHVQALLNASMPGHGQGGKMVGNRVSALWRLQDELLLHIRSLQALGIEGSEYGFLLTPLILSRLPNDIRMEWARESDGREADLEFLLDFMKREINRRERSETFKVLTKTDNVGTQGHGIDATADMAEDKQRVATASALQSPSVASHSGGNSCGVCGKTHQTEKCWGLLNLPVSERHSKVQSCKLCFRCLGKSHFAKGCIAQCSKCKGRHHAILCNGGGGSGKVNKARQSGSPSVSKTQSGDSKGTGKSSSSDTGVKTPEKSKGQDTGTMKANMHSISAGSSVNSGSRVNTVLQTAKVKIVGRQGCTEATLMFDSGSDRSYITSSMVKRVKPEWVGTEPISYAAFGCNTPSVERQCNIYDVHLSGSHTGSGENISLNVAEVPVICNPLVRPLVPCELLNILGSDIQLADSVSENREITVDILVGLDLYWKLMKPQRFRQVGGLVAQESCLGWVLSSSWSDSGGGVQSVQSGACSVSPQLMCLGNVGDSDLRRFWDLESVGISLTEQETLNLKIDPVLKHFSENVQKNGSRYQVALPWKSETAKGRLLNNEAMAWKRLKQLNRRFDGDPELKQRYDQVFREYESSGFIVEVLAHEMENPNPTFYLPHRPVVREDSLTTKVRPVFDASASGYNGVSLNDCLETEPSLLASLVDILIRFRRWPVAITADVTKAFLQIGVRPEDQDVHRFLWDDGGRVRVMKFVRVPFGNKASPFLLNATIRHHLDSYPPSEVVQELKDNIYMDDFLSGCDEATRGCEVFDEAQEVMGEAELTFAKCTSNNKVLVDKFRSDFGSKHVDSESVKVLGMSWLSREDCFVFEGIPLPPSAELSCTKRVVLSFTARLFDPLGLLSPFIMMAKILFQEIWRLGLGWDEELPPELKLRFISWLDGISVIKQWKIPRCYTSGGPWKGIVGLELHAFGDSSTLGYGACVYLRIPKSDGTYEVSLVFARARVAPVKPVSLPRLELIASLLCARILVFTRSALKLPEDTTYHCYSDSQVALAWIKGDPCRWKSFVANRVGEIQQLTSPSHWSHCPGPENPSDLVTRGLSAKKLITSESWLHGPVWLASSSDSVDLIEEDSELENCDESVSSLLVPVGGEVVKQEPAISQLFDLNNLKSYPRTIRLVALVMRFCHNLRSAACDRRLGQLSQDERSKAQVQLFRLMQDASYHREIEALRKGKPLPRDSAHKELDPFLDKTGLLRMKGRLQFSELSYDSKHPIILPKGRVSYLLVRFQHFLMKHAGVTTLLTALRSNYWIVGLRQLAKHVCKECVPCRIVEARACNQVMAPLPGFRVKDAPCFAVTGLDHGGPLFCIDFPKKKFYILLFTCAVVRAVHLELTDSLNLPDCILAIRRFAARRGLPSEFHSDNAATFTGADTLLQQYFGPHSPKWNFIAPRSPWWGGFWERLVGSVKRSLRKSLGKKSLTRSELETTLHEVEANVNSRPLTFVGDSLDSPNPLTPSHFLIGRPAGFQVEIAKDSLNNPEVVLAKDLGAREAVRQARLDDFWKVWSDDYLRNLPPVSKKFQASCNVKVGSVVLIREDHVPRMSWPLAVVTETFPGRDGIVRSVRLKTATGFLTRSVQRLHDLEISAPLPNQDSDASETNNVDLNESFSQDLVADLRGNLDTDVDTEAVSVVETSTETPSRPSCDSDDSVAVAKTTRTGRVVRPRDRLDL